MTTNIKWANLLSTLKKKTSISDRGFFTLITRSLQENELFSWRQFVIFFLITFVLYGYFITHFTLSLDSEYAAFRSISSDAGNAWINEGRWLNFLLERYVFAQPVVPYATHLLFCFSIVLSYMLVVSAHKIENRLLIYITYPLFCAFPIWLFLLVFYGNIPGTSVGILLVSMAIFIFSLYRNIFLEKSFKFLEQLFPLFIQGILLAMAIGAYQAFLLVYMAMGVGLVLLSQVSSHKNNISLKETFLNFCYLGCVMFLGLFFYFVINELAKWLIPPTDASFYSILKLHNFFKEPFYAIEEVFTQAFSYYSGSPYLYGASLSFSGILINLTGIALLIHLTLKMKIKPFISNILLWVLLLIIPFLLNFISWIPTRSLLAIPYVIWVTAIIAYSIGRHWFKRVILIVVMILELQIIHVMGINAAAMDIMGNYDRALAANIYERIGGLSGDGCHNVPCRLDVFGVSQSPLMSSPYPVVWSSTMGASFFERDLDRMITFMRLIGYGKFVAIDSETRKKNTTIFEKMPTWPADGSIIKYKGMYLVKLSNFPDKTHRQISQ